MSAVANAFPELIVSLYDAYDEGDEERARELQSQVYAIRSALKGGSYMAGVKTTLDVLDLDFSPGPLRSPLRKMSEADQATLESDLRELDML